ncbi:MAG: hypothetical protein DRJ03_10890 [Chloroflexi bacterium]|nr:MAG: hypothetical protein DRJ03_10890 [Chloroflexota bacterium]
MRSRIWNWYQGLPWYWKVLGAVVLIFLVLLTILSAFKRATPDHRRTDDAHNATVDTALDGLKSQDAAVAKAIRTKKKDIAVKLNQAGKIDNTTLLGRKRIEEASTMDELDALQKELGL